MVAEEALSSVVLQLKSLLENHGGKLRLIDTAESHDLPLRLKELEPQNKNSNWVKYNLS